MPLPTEVVIPRIPERKISRTTLATHTSPFPLSPELWEHFSPRHNFDDQRQRRMLRIGGTKWYIMNDEWPVKAVKKKKSMKKGKMDKKTRRW